jgi:GlcNAc-P-P-Und epimerase
VTHESESTRRAGRHRAPEAGTSPQPGSRVLITGGSGFIGTNLVASYADSGASVLNLDAAAPRDDRHRHAWRAVDILDRAELIAAFRQFAPHHVIHLAARTDLDERKDISGYAANIDGVANVIAAVRATAPIERVVFASSRLVCRIGYSPVHDTDYCPTTLYGASKVKGEELVRAVGGDFPIWTIVRPTSIWGPWFGVPYRNLFELIARGRYFHPGKHNPRKSFGYVGNTVQQIEAILKADAAAVEGHTFWLADRPILLQEWTEQIRAALEAPPIRRLPVPALAAAAKVGDLLSKVGIREPPITTFRLNNLLTEMVYDTSATEAVIGPPRYAMAESLAATATWLKAHPDGSTP